MSSAAKPAAKPAPRADQRTATQKFRALIAHYRAAGEPQPTAAVVRDFPSLHVAYIAEINAKLPASRARDRELTKRARRIAAAS
ncbi:MAG: hypothetical protein WD316_08565 [Phycisphaeraceae bacterium]